MHPNEFAARVALFLLRIAQHQARRIVSCVGIDGGKRGFVLIRPAQPVHRLKTPAISAAAAMA